MEVKKNLFFENLNGLRFFCFLSVFLHHSFFTENQAVLSNPVYQFLKYRVVINGNIGVNFFFVLSGFLITYLLLVEKANNGKIQVFHFWMRRILRIWPLYFFCVIFGFYIFPIVKTILSGSSPVETANIWYFLFFISNFDLVLHGAPDSSVLGVLWSVAIEEQFYLFWPILIHNIQVKKLWILFLSIILASISYRYYHQSYIVHHFSTLSCIGDMAMGAFGAWAVLQFDGFKDGIARVSRPSIILMYILFFALFFYRHVWVEFGIFFQVMERMILSIFILFIILEQNYAENSWFKMSRWKLISNLGTYTYGMYCLHFIAILFVIQLLKLCHISFGLYGLVLIEMPLTLIGTVGMSWFSYHYFELKFLNLKSKFP